MIKLVWYILIKFKVNIWIKLIWNIEKNLLLFNLFMNECMILIDDSYLNKLS